MSAYLGTLSVSIKKALYRNHSTVDLLAKGTSVLGSIEDAVKALFAGGKQGIWLDPSDLSTMFKDAAGTQPVTANGDPVGLIRDKSGNGYHATQTVSASRPTYKTDGILHWLAFDGVDDSLKASYASTMLQPATLAIAFNTINNNNGNIINGSVSTKRHNIFQFGSNLRFFAGQEVATTLVATNSQAVYRFLFNGANSSVTKNGVTGAVVNTGDYPTQDLIIGSVGIKLYGLIQAIELLDSTTKSDIDKYLATKAGVTL